MNAHMRTLLTVICDAALEKKLVADLQVLGAPGWTISDARGRGGRGVRSAGWDTEGHIRLEIICTRDIAERIAEGHHEGMPGYETLGPDAHLAVPTPEHYLPLLYVLALQRDSDTVEFFNDEVSSSISIRSVLLGAG